MALRHASLLAATGLLVLAAGPVWAADDGYQDVFSSVATAVGIMKADPSPEIDYRERSPLVLPPKMDLPHPAAEIAHPASWPTDPDVARRGRAAADGRAPSENLLGNRNEVLSKAELMKGRVNTRDGDSIPESSLRASRCGKDGNNRACLPTSDDLAAEGENFKANNPETADKKELQAGVEPDRVYLTQPPKGYMKTSKTVKVTTEAPRVYHDESNPAAALVYKPKPDEE